MREASKDVRQDDHSPRTVKLPDVYLTLHGSPTHVVVTHTMLVLLSLLPVGYQCQCIFSSNVHNDLL